ncbi:hypothetical protein K474DRAFT_1655720 [Panus rudis PR-1116 ss-1]|nr:hypothetical protein K474DRAFT_1655720 [Panus rudis PR-1116 ss-1]
MSPQPRPILKRETSFSKQMVNLPFAVCGTLMSPHVHFPPTPVLTETHPTHSPQTYDRAPILVSPNACLLPRRNDRRASSPRPSTNGGSTHRGRSPHRRDHVKGSYFHPRAYEACEPEPLSPPTSPQIPPLLVHDVPSPSDEEVITPPDSAFDSRTAHEGSPLLTDVYVSSSTPTPRSSAQHGVEKRRPHLRRTGNERYIKRTGVFCPQLDEGCLGGF